MSVSKQQAISGTIKKPRFFYGYIIALACMVVIGTTWGSIDSFGVFLKPVSTELGWSRGATSGAFSMFMLLLAFNTLLIGRLTDRFGPRVVVSACGVVFGVAYLLASRIGMLWQLYALYAIMSFGASGGFVPVVATTARWFVKRRGLMTGIVTAGTGFGTMIAAPVSSWLILAYGWRDSYFATGVAVLILLVISTQALKRDPKTIGQLPYGEGETGAETGSLERGVSLSEAVRTRQFPLLCFAYLSLGISTWAVTVHIVPHATDLGISPLAAANVLTFVGASNAGGRIMLGSTGDRIGYRGCTLIAGVLIAASLLFLQFADSLWMLYLTGVIFGLGNGGIAALMSPVVAELFGLRNLGTILSFMSFSWLTGGAIGPILGGYIFDSSQSYRIAFLIFLITSVIGVFAISSLFWTGRRLEA